MSARMCKGAAFGLCAGLLAVSGCGGERTPRDASTPSGYAVPRYLVLKFDEINARAGPSEDHAILATYRAPGMPVQVIAETKDWRRICDPLGEIAWVAARMLDGQRAVIRVDPGAAAVRRSPRGEAPVVASLPERGRADLLRCEGDWCRVKVGSASGWVMTRDVWGVDPAVQCEGLPAPASLQSARD